MASSSSTRVAAAAGTTYQVFLSFRGPDTRQGFTDTLYHLLVDAGVRVFRDNEEIPKGEKIGNEILRAIEESKIFVPIFSTGYASSKWCLIEFTKMVELEEGSSGKNIIPIFYDVGVEDVKLRTNLYSKALKEHSQKYGAETVKPWEEALRQAGKFKGWELKDQGHAELAKLVVRDVSMKLKLKHKCLGEYFVQRDDQVEALMKLLDIESSDVRFVGIYGMGGIGKTTLSKIVFNKICDRFDCSSFLTDVRESSRQHKGIEHLQKQLMGDLGLGSGEIRDVDDGIQKISQSLVQKKVLIVLDDVDHSKQIRSLAKDPSWFASSSRIIITTRNKDVLEMGPLRGRTLEVEEMKPGEARELFCMHAFEEGAPLDDYLSLLEDAIASTGRLPLALEVIGSHLRGRSYKDWVAIIRRLEITPHKDVQEKLRISYESLDDWTKQIFLDIACFFIGEEITCPIYMWQACGLDPEMRLKELVDKSLVKLIEEERGGLKRNMLRMHDQLRDLGREIVNHMSFKDDVKPSRMWSEEDASKMLHGEEGQEHIEMLRFHGEEETEEYTFSMKDILSLRKLRYLECSGANFSGELKDMLPKLRWLRWSHAPPEIEGTGIFLRNLVILDLSYSDIDENWSGWVQIGVGSTLKVLNLSCCFRLTRTPDLSSYSSLEMLILDGCSELVEIDPSIGKLKSLKNLDVSDCGSLKGIPEEICSLYNLEVVTSSEYDMEFNVPEMIGDLTSLLFFQVHCVQLPKSIAKLARLRYLLLAGCYGLGVLPDTLGDMKSLVKLDLSFTDAAELPDTIGQLVKLEVLSLHGCDDLKKLPVSIGNMKSLVELHLLQSGITELPDSIGNLENLRVMDMRCTKIKELPSSFGMLRRLEHLDASYTRLAEIPSTFEGLTCLTVLKLDWTPLCRLPPKLPTGLTDVGLRSLSLLERAPELSNLQNLVRLGLTDLDMFFYEGCPTTSEDEDASEDDDACDESGSSEVQPIKLEGIGKLCGLVELRLDLWDVTHIPEEFSSLPRLQTLNLGCPNIQFCPPLPSTLSHLTLTSHGEMAKLPRLSNLKNLSTLVFERFSLSDDMVGNLGIGELDSLQELSIRSCGSIETLPNMSKLKSLRRIEIRNCKKFKDINDTVGKLGIGELDSLQELSIRSCGSIETLPNMSKLKSLRRIEIRNCKKFKDINGISELKSLEHLLIEGCDCEDVDGLPQKTQGGSRKRPFEDLY